jgi:fimbrial isopeptide formation D2 family protein
MRGGGMWRRRWTPVVVSAALVAGGVSLPAAVWAAGNTASLSLSKEVFQPGTTTPLTGPVTPGQAFDYSITAACSGLTQGCISAKTVDVIPAGITIQVPPSQPPLYTVVYDAATRTLTVTYTDALAAPPNPAGSQGLSAGSARDLTIRATVNQNATDGQKITNTAQVTADNASPASGSSTVTVTVPSVIQPAATKSFAPSSMMAQSHAGSTITLGAVNNSSSTARVKSLTVGDHTPNTWDDFDLTGVGPVTRFPAGADQVAVAVCTQPQPCTAAQVITGPPQSGPSMTLPSGVNPAQVTGVD